MPKEKFFDPRKPFQSQRPETHEEWQARMGGEVLAVVRSGIYPCTGRMLHQSYSLAVRLDTAVYVKRSPLLFR